jgi:large subunit ribosomal protein L4
LLRVDKTVLIVEEAKQESRNLGLSARNIQGLELIRSNEVHPYHLLRYDRVIFSQPAIEKLQVSLKSSVSKRQHKPKEKEDGGKKAISERRRRPRHDKAAEVA